MAAVMLVKHGHAVRWLRLLGGMLGLGNMVVVLMQCWSGGRFGGSWLQGWVHSVWQRGLGWVRWEKGGVGGSPVTSTAFFQTTSPVAVPVHHLWGVGA